jgi:predicted ester cyclase
MILNDGHHMVAQMDNTSRFRTFVNLINLQRWESLGDVVRTSLSYNKRDMPLDEFATVLKHEFGPTPTSTIEIVTIVGGGESGDNVDSPVGARLRVRTGTLVTNPEGPEILSESAARPAQAEFARHMFVHFHDDQIGALYDMSERSQNQGAGPQTETVLPPPSPSRPPPALSSIDMRQFYADYIACINSGNMARELHRFCSPSGVVWNGTRFTVQQYGDMMQESMDAISGLRFDIHTLLVDENRQQLAARLEFTGTPVRPYQGGIPNGRPVFFAEHVFYWLEQGRISDVLSIVDWEDYRSQLAR